MTKEAFRELRKELNYSQEGFANRLGVSRRIIQYYESGEMEIPKVVELAIQAITLEEK